MSDKPQKCIKCGHERDDLSLCNQGASGCDCSCIFTDNRTREVLRCAQAILTALNVGDVQKESALHLKLREVMINYRATPTKDSAVVSPVLAFDEWLTRWVSDNGRKLTQTEYGIAYAAFIAAHPGEGPLASVMSPDPEARAREFAAGIVTAWLWHTPEHDQERARMNIVQRILPALQTRSAGYEEGIKAAICVIEDLRKAYDVDKQATEDYEYDASLRCALGLADAAISRLESLSVATEGSDEVK